MTHFVDSLPFDWTVPAAGELRDLLAAAYYQRAPVVAMAQQAGVAVAHVNWDQPMAAVWHDLIAVARGQDRLRTLLALIESGPDRAVASRVGELLRARPVVEAPEPAVRAPAPWRDPAAPGPALPPRTWQHFTEPDPYERQILATGSFLDVSFLRRGLELSSAVARLLVTCADGRQYHGTAFRIGPDLLLTNHHVLYDDTADARPMAAVEAWFGYEKDVAGRDLAHRSVPCDPGSTAGDAAHDWAVIRVAGAMPADAAVVELPDRTTVAAGDRVYIIQHPHGGVKKLAAHHNLVRHVDDDVVQYWTDTDTGSSGSPVFDERWRLVALHHRWVRIGDLSQPPEYRNQGIRIERVTAGLKSAGRV